MVLPVHLLSSICAAHRAICVSRQALFISCGRVELAERKISEDKDNLPVLFRIVLHPTHNICTLTNRLDSPAFGPSSAAVEVYRAMMAVCGGISTDD